MREVYYYKETNEVSFTYVRNESVCIGETDGTLEDFLNWMRDEWVSRDVDTEDLPTIKV